MHPHQKIATFEGDVFSNLISQKGAQAIAKDKLRRVRNSSTDSKDTEEGEVTPLNGGVSWAIFF